jgi:membrane protein implicated in regulation of membrane protease activity
MLLSISTWWEHLATFEKTLWAIAILFSTIYLFQSILSISGGDVDHASGDADGSVEHDHGMDYQFFTIRNMIAFFMMFGWTGIASHYGGLGKTATVLLAFAAGSIVVILTVLILKNMSRLRHSGTMNIANAINLTGTTYLFIPANRGGMGKVHIKVQGSLRELQAVTDDDTEIATGSLIRVKNIINDNILLVTLADSLPYKI